MTRRRAWGRSSGQAGKTPREAFEPVMKGVEDEGGRALRAGVLDGLGDHGLGREEIAQAMLVDLGHLLPRPCVEDASATRGGFPELARGIPPRATLLPPGKPGEHPLARRALEATLQRGAIAGLTALGIHPFPEPPEPGH